MKRIQVLLSMFLLLFICSCADRSGTTKTNKNGVFINLTSSITTSSHSLLMGLHVAQKALRNDMETTVFVNVDAVSLFKDGAEMEQCHGENLHVVLNDILEHGGEILCCPHCLESAGLGKEDLIIGVELSKEDVLMSTLSENVTCLSY